MELGPVITGVGAHLLCFQSGEQIKVVSKGSRTLNAKREDELYSLGTGVIGGFFLVGEEHVPIYISEEYSGLSRKEWETGP